MTDNPHAEKLEPILLRKGFRITKAGGAWRITSGSGRLVVYHPETGAAVVPISAIPRKILRGNPQVIAGIIEGLVKETP